ncbi:hypothetical protein CU097_000436, partial [Rhizopus azygosporus]
DMWVSVRGTVYDITNFARTQHGASGNIATTDLMDQIGGYDMSDSIPPPLTTACQGLVTSSTVKITPNVTTVRASFIHYSGDQNPIPTLTKMSSPTWYWDYFLPTMSLYKKGQLVIPISGLYSDYQSWSRLALAINGKVYDITDYMSTAKTYDSGSTSSTYHFLHATVEEIFTKFSGTDATDKWNQYKASMTAEQQAQNMACLDNYFYIGNVDERDTPRCMFTNYFLTGPFPMLAIIMLAGVYGLQALLFIKQKKIIVADDEKFDEKMIPLKKWSVYEQELWEMGSTGSKETRLTGHTYKSYQTHGSRNNPSVMYDSRTQYAGSQAGDYDYYRDTTMHENKRTRSPGYTGSVIAGSEYGGAATHDFMMTPPPMPRQQQAMSVHSFGPDYHDMNNTFDVPMRPTSQFSIPLSQGGMLPMLPPGFPSDDEILSEIRNILQTANLMSITKKQVREQLSAFFGYDMTPKKEFINTSIEYILKGQL